MTEGLFSAVDLGSTERAGYRLHHLEVFNWGTFDQRVWRLTAAGETSLLTGDIGSGKSTLVDALTTLLLPAHRIAYNKAAGADTKERTLRSYVEGHYKSERIESTGTSRAVGLRDHRAYSVLLGVFVNEGYDETVTLAQVFHQKDRSGQPDRFFVTSTKELSIEADFTAFGSDLTELRRRLRASGAELTNTFTDYSRHVRRLLAIRSDQAMELFHQTVSMKSVGNLNEFVRNHMLEPVDASDKVRAIVAHFDDLTKAHEAVRRAKDQLAALDPLATTADSYDEALARRGAMERQRDATQLYFTELRITLLEAQLDRDSATLKTRGHEAEESETRLRELREARETLLVERAGAGGDRLADLERTEAEQAQFTDQRRVRRERYDAQLSAAGLASVSDAASFRARHHELADQLSRLRDQRTGVDQRRGEQLARRGQVSELGDAIRIELTSLAGRRSNLPSHLVDVREQLCEALGLELEQLPFAGELMDVHEGHRVWRGAAERVLRGFAQSLLVPHDHYADVSRWVNERRLTHARRDGSRAGVRLVYERVPRRRVPVRSVEQPGVLMLADTLELATGPFEDYLRDQLVRRADHRCVDTLEEFQQAERAVTRAGQVRSGDRHEKDDRSRADDPRTWMLGWTNESKVEALTEQLLGHQTELLAIEQQLEAVDRDQHELDQRATALAKLEEHTTWTDLDWQAAHERAEAARTERERLLAGSTRLAEIETQLEANGAGIESTEQQLGRIKAAVAVLEDRIGRATRDRQRDEALVATTPPDELERSRAAFPGLTSRLGDHSLDDPDSCDRAAAGLTRDLTAGIEKVGRELGGYTTSLLQYMTDVRRRWPEATTEMDVSVEARADYRAFRDRVAQDDLPAFEGEFKRQLNTNTIRELAAFNNWLRRQAEEIHGRVDRINEALGTIDYSPGRYITLVPERTVNQEVQAFRADLRDATSDALDADDDRYSEQRFLEVQRIIERFRSREGHAEADKAWTRRVTDVRNWYTFSASERDKETDEEWEHYRDSDGKSGGQKEKLAYTILAASLAYQFGLDWGVERSRDFRFAVIDEAFGRGSDASTRYALDLFGKLGLQLLIVTPLQKVHVIEPYVQAIGFVDNPTGSFSRLQTLTIEEFRARRTGGEG
jgi:uncharacterized protein YPO0396